MHIICITNSLLFIFSLFSMVPSDGQNQTPKACFFMAKKSLYYIHIFVRVFKFCLLLVCFSPSGICFCEENKLRFHFIFIHINNSASTIYCVVHPTLWAVGKANWGSFMAFSARVLVSVNLSLNTVFFCSHQFDFLSTSTVSEIACFKNMLSYMEGQKSSGYISFDNSWVFVFSF